MTTDRPIAPALTVARWFNARAPITLQGLRGKIVVVQAFQMLCPGCVAHSIPQAKKLHELARGTDVQVLGIHTVFEHHAAMTPMALEAFLHEYRITFPVAVDEPGDNHPLPKTMAAYGMRGTPSTIVIDRMGRIARHSFGAEDDLAFGLFLGGLAGERDAGAAQSAVETGICKIDEGCA
jgi:peroxiredoxin